MSRRSNGRLGPPVEDLEHADRALVVEERHRDDGPRHVAGLLGGRPAEAGVDRDVGQGERLAGREHVAGDPLVGPDRQPDDAVALASGRDLEDQLPRRRVVERDRRGLRVEQRDGRLDDRAQQERRRRRGEAAAGLETERDRPDGLERTRGGRVVGVRRVGESVGSPPAGPVTARPCAPAAPGR
jgi:hypothetical protein